LKGKNQGGGGVRGGKVRGAFEVGYRVTVNVPGDKFSRKGDGRGSGENDKVCVRGTELEVARENRKRLPSRGGGNGKEVNF